MVALSKAASFDMTLMFMDSKEKKDLVTIVQFLKQQVGSVDKDVLKQIDILWTFEWCGFGCGESHLNHLQIWTIPYWSITIPLTALSAFLLLSKPRQSTQKKTLEPISVGGA